MDKGSEPLTKSQAIEQVIAQITDPMDLEEFTSQVLALWTSNAKNPKAGIRKTLKYDFLGRDLLFLDKQTLIPLRLAMRGVRFRVSFSRQELNKGWLFVFPAFQFLAPRGLPTEQYWLEDVNGRSIPVNPVTVKSKVKTIFGVEDIEQTAFDLKWWYKKHALRRGDSLLVTVLDWEKGRFCLEPEPARLRQRHATEIQAQNQALADDLFQQLEAAPYEEVRGTIAIPTAYLHLKDLNAYPADHWLEVLEQDPRMYWAGYEIRYADWTSPFESMFTDLHSGLKLTASSRQRPLPKQESRQVYRFKVALWHNKRLWRRIEIQGGQSLGEFDDILRTAFVHDHFDHLSGFWKLVRRGQSRRFREVDLGDMNPYEGGEAADIQIASLSLFPGDALKYVYDFGDWIQHRLELESIGEPEENASYPRITGQNKPRYQDCQVCKDEGRKAVATWVCYSCSNKEQKDILLCETCLEAHDEDHYLEEILY
jgi:hypothetical protein